MNIVPTLKGLKSVIRPYLRNLPENKLLVLIAKTKDGQLAFQYCSDCLLGVVGGGTQLGYLVERNNNPLAPATEYAYGALYTNAPTFSYSVASSDCLIGQCRSVEVEVARDAIRNRRLLPMLRAELHRRDVAKAQEESCRLSKQSENVVSVLQGATVTTHHGPLARIVHTVRSKWGRTQLTQRRTFTSLSNSIHENSSARMATLGP